MWMTMICIEHNRKDNNLVARKYALQRRFDFAISQKMDMIFEATNARFSDHEKKVGKKLMEMEHRFHAKYITMSEDLINIRSKTGNNPRLSKAEDEIKDLRRELHFTKEDIETAVFIRKTYNPVEISRIGDISLTAEKLKRNLSNQYIYDDVIMPYARISQIENDTTSIISPHETDKLLRMKGVVPGHGASWVGRVAEKCVGRRKVHVPLNVHQNHWMLMMFNFDKEEIQILNSLNNHCDKTKEDSLKEVYDAQQAVETKGSEDDVQLINDPVGSNEPDTTNSQKDTGTPGSLKRKRARGCPRKNVDPEAASKTKSLEELKLKFDSKTIAKQVSSLSSRSCRDPKPSAAMLSPFKHK
uniref:Ubiquitin-like protease family profile domain-containing protein n=1 Tax=Aegilops tauschii TaxID=37682 RepID=R7W7R7_AEGTA